MTVDDELRQVLQRRTEDLPDTIELADVYRRVRRLRRRRLTTVVLAAAVTALSVPVSLTLNGPDSTRPVAPHPAPAVRPSVSSTATRAARPVEQLQPSKAFSVLAAGPAPRLAYVYGEHTLVVPGEGPRSLPGRMAAATALSPLADGWLVASAVGADGRTSELADRGGAVVTLLDSSLRPVWSREGSDRIASGGDLASYVTTAPESTSELLRLVRSDGTDAGTWTLAPGQQATPIGIMADHGVVYNATSSAGDSLGAFVARVGAEPERLPLDSADTAAGDLVGGRRADGCTVVRDLGAQRDLWTSCDGLRLAAFSPDGRHVAAWHSETGGEFESVRVLDARTGRRIADTTTHSPDGFHALPAGPVAWEDDDHLLGAFYDGRSQSWALVRLGRDGRLERATDAFQTEGGPPFVLATGR